MIPLKLSLENFLCYGEDLPVLDLQGVHVACLCGNNGHGKSALLDAITWALWGKARGKSNDELVHYSRTDMWVELDFLARDSHYKVLRRYSSGGGRRRQPTSDLQLQLVSDDNLLPITGNTIRGTQSRIDQIIGMDYETFINSAFLLQGRADEFTNKSPGDRKEVLAKVLELELYDRLQDRAREAGDQHKTTASVLEADLARLGTEVSRKDSISQELQDAERQSEKVAQDLAAARTKAGDLKLQVDDLERIVQERARLLESIPHMKGEISSLETQLTATQERIEKYESLAARREEVILGLARFKELRQTCFELDQAREQHDQLTGQRSDLEKQLADAQARLEERITQARTRLEGQLRPKALETAEVQQAMEAARKEISLVEAEELSISQEQVRLQEVSSRVGQHKAVSEQLRAEGQELRSKLNLTNAAGSAGDCPLCGTTLGDEGCLHLAETYESQIKEKLDQYNKEQADLKNAEREAQSLGEELPRRQQDVIRRRQTAQNTLTKLGISLDECNAAALEITELEASVTQQERDLQQKAFAPSLHLELEQVTRDLVSLAYDQGRHRELYRQMEEHRTFEEGSRLLEEAEAQLPQAREFASTTGGMLDLRRKDLEGSLARSTEIESRTGGLGDLRAELDTSSRIVASLERQQEDMLRRQGELQGSLRKLEQVSAEMDVKERSLKDSRDSQGIYQDLVEAFGRRGIQAMLIETVLPRVEDEANALLGRMTDGRMNVKLETQRQRRSGRGDPIETLEIIISDEVGPRSYE
ncbi:MAG: SMC family ATPase, partial [Dehalococcoidia bacterium]|nr:SMC family ATPase [Dehalococcoidia bacterium]